MYSTQIVKIDFFLHFTMNYNHINQTIVFPIPKYYNEKIEMNSPQSRRNSVNIQKDAFHIEKEEKTPQIDIFSSLDEIENDNIKDQEIERLKQEKMELIIQNNKLQMLYNELLNSNNTFKTKAVQYDRIINRQTLIRNRYLFSISFLQSCSQYACVYGSLIRKLFELVFHLHSFETNNTKADCINTDINILFNSQNTPDKIKVASEFYSFIHSLEISRLTSEKKNSGVEVPTFAGYRLTGINNSVNFISNGECIPRSKLFFIKDTDSISVDLIAWRYKEIVDFSVNNYILTYDGIRPLLEYNFLNYLENIHFEQTKYFFRPDLLQTLAYPPGKSLPRNEKLLHLSKMYELISNRVLKILPSNYKITKYNAVSIESKDDCTITGCKAPYPILNLLCGHKLSIMAYKGILFKTSDNDTQSLRCPLCREDLKIKFENNNECHTTKYNLLSPNECLKLSKELNIQSVVVDSKFISKDAIEYL
jgi:hypothetical protein